MLERRKGCTPEVRKRTLGQTEKENNKEKSIN